MRNLPPTRLADKVVKPLQINLITTIIVALLTKSPLSSEPWLAWLSDTAVVAALVTLIGGIVGYQVSETAYDR